MLFVEFVVEKIFARGGDERVVVVAADLQRVNCGGGARVAWAALSSLIGKAAAVADGAAPHVFDGVVNGLLWHVESAVFRCAKGDDLHDGDADVRIAGPWLVAPAALVLALVALRGDDEFDGALKFFADGRAARFAVNFAECDGGDAVVIHVFAAVHAAELSVHAELIEQELHAAFHLLGVFALLGEIARSHVGHEHVAGHRDGMLALSPGADAPRAVRILLRSEPTQRAVDDLFARRIHDHGVLHVGIHGSLWKCERSQREEDDEREAEHGARRIHGARSLGTAENSKEFF